MEDSRVHMGMALFLCGVLCTTNTAIAGLTVTTDAAYPGQTVVVDDATGYFWYWAIHDLGGLTYEQQKDYIAVNIAGTSYFGKTSWHMATAADMAALLALSPEEIALSFEVTQDWGYRKNWIGRYDEPVPNASGKHYGLEVEWESHDGYEMAVLPYYDWDTGCTRLGAWVVSWDPVIPAPAAVTLAASGVGLIVWLRRRRVI